MVTCEMQVRLCRLLKDGSLESMKGSVPLNGRRSFCPINFAVESLGDKWSLVILRDVVFWGLHTYGELLRSDEGISTNILADRLDQLTREGFLTRQPDLSDKRKDVFYATEKTVELLPLFVEMIAWSAKQDDWQTMDHRAATPEQHQLVTDCLNGSDRKRFIARLQKAVRDGKCVFDGVARKGHY